MTTMLEPSPATASAHPSMFSRSPSVFSKMSERKKQAQRMIFAAVEGGGQSWLVLISEGVNPPKELDSARIPTLNEDGSPRKAEDVIEECVQRLRDMQMRLGHNFESIGIVSFGPCDLRPDSKTYGFITTTPKEGWQMTNVVGPFSRAFPNVPIAFDTDVNMVAVSEFAYGGHGNITSAAYITVGTGIGVGMCTNGKAVHGLIHPEGGHIRCPRFTKVGAVSKEEQKYLTKEGRDTYKGNCKFHCIDEKGEPKLYPCVEGMANSQAIADRLGIPKSDLRNVSDDHPIWDLHAYYLAQLCMSITFLMSPEVIVLGGGVMNREVLYPKIRKHLQSLLGGYFVDPKFNTDIDKYIVRSRFDAIKGKVHAGVMGGLELARRVWELSDKKVVKDQQEKIKALNEALEKQRVSMTPAVSYNDLAKLIPNPKDVKSIQPSRFRRSSLDSVSEQVVKPGNGMTKAVPSGYNKSLTSGLGETSAGTAIFFGAGMLLLGLGAGFANALTSTMLSRFLPPPPKK